MKSNFALSLSFDGLRLMHRNASGWDLVGEVALDDADVMGALARLKSAADTLEPNGIATKLLIPNDQIKYLALDTTRVEEAEVRDALTGATPYAVDDLTYDFAKGGGRTYVAAVAKETLEEAQQFATDNGFNPVSFAAVPEPFTYVGEAFFGPTEGNTAERDDEPVIVTGMAAVSLPEAEVPSEPEPSTPTETDVTDEPEAEAVAKAEVEVPADEPAAPSVDAPIEVAPVDDILPAESDDVAQGDAAVEDIADAPVFSSRLRADRDEGRPAPKPEPQKTAPSRAEPTLSKPALAVPTASDSAAAPAPSLAAPSRDPEASQPPVPPSVTADAPIAESAPAITGEAPNALPPEIATGALPAAARVSVEGQQTSGIDTAQALETTKKAAASAMGAATAMTGAAKGALGGIFASRRMKPAEAETADAAATTDAPAAKSRLSVFGARKQKTKPKVVVGGKPRFLGLILTAILLLFLLAIAAFAALSEEGFARWFGFGASETQIATPANPDDIAPEVAAIPPDDPDQTAAVSEETVAAPLQPLDLPEGSQILTPEDAQRIYAATGVWQRAPRIPQIPRTTDIDSLILGVVSRPVPRVPPSPLADAGSVAGDAVIATPVDPPAPDTTFEFDSNGLILATAEGAVTPDGILVIAGRPPLEPPTRPGTIAPEVTPQDQLAAVVPDTAETLDAPEGVIVIAGRPVIEPPVRSGTVSPAPTPQDTAVASGTAPLLATDGLLVLSGAPPILPPIRPGTVAPTAQAETLSEDIAAALAIPPTDAVPETGTAQAPDADTLRPLPRPAAIVQAAVAAANAPVLGDLTANQAAAFRPRTRPAGLAPLPEPEPEVEPETLAAAEPATPTLQIAPEIAAAVQAAANRPNPIVNPTALAVPISSRPDLRPRNMARIVERAAQAQQRAAAQVASVTPTAVAPSGPTSGSVAQNATLENAINLRNINLIGIYGGSNDRRALVRLGNGRYVRVTVGDRLDGGRVTAISASALSYTKGGRAVTLQVAG